MRIKLIVSIIIMSVLLLCMPTHAMTISELEDTVVVIVIDPLPGLNPGHGPKSPSVVPISANYDSMLSSVILYFTSNLGEIEVEVVNTTTGGYDAGTIDTQLLYATVPITMGPGHYLIIFTLPSGRQYKGEFDC